MNSVIYPRISEKAYGTAGELNCYTFVVPAEANKLTVKTDVEKEYEVTVLSVNMSVLKGKDKRFMMRRGKTSNGTRANIKKAYVTLKEGDSIPVFAEAAAEEANAAAAIAAPKGKKAKRASK